MPILSAEIKRVSFADGNYFIGDAATGGKFAFETFTATSRLIDRLKAGPKKTDVVKITAVERTPPRTRAGKSSVRELTLSIPAALDIGEYELKGTDGTSFSYTDADGIIVEANGGTLTIQPSTSNLVKGEVKAQVDVPGSDGESFELKARFQVLKAG